MNDEKVLQKQKKNDEEFMKQKKVKQISEAEKILEERKRKLAEEERENFSFIRSVGNYHVDSCNLNKKVDQPAVHYHLR